MSSPGFIRWIRKAPRFAALLLFAAFSASSTARADALLNVIILDSGSGEPVHARCGVWDRSGFSVHPDADSCLYHSFGGGYFYCQGGFTVSVPEGQTLIRLSKGPEYRPFQAAVIISCDTTVTCILERTWDMREDGWFSGDVHTHLDHIEGCYDLTPSDAHAIGLAEDLQFVSCLDNDFHFTGTADESSCESCVVYMSEEWRSNIYGHCSLPGLTRLVEPFFGVWGDPPCDVADSVHAQQGPIFIYAHPVTTYDFDMIEDWPGTGLARSLPVDAVCGRVDAFEVMSCSNADGAIELDMWYRLLGCGFIIPPCAGTDAVVNRYFDPPMGGFRTYAQCAQGDPDMHGWLGAIASGKCFVTNGPLFREFRVNGHFESGDSLYIESGAHPFFVDVTVECAFPMERVEVVVNGAVVDTLYPSGDPLMIAGRSDFLISSSSWIAARVKGESWDWYTLGSDLFAHTGPVYAHLSGVHVLRWDAANYFTEWIDSLISLIEEKGEWYSAADSVRVCSEIHAARAWYAALAGTSTGTGWLPAGVVPSARRVEIFPNPFSSTVRISLVENCLPVELEDGDVMRAASAGSQPEVTIYDVSGRLVRRLEAVASAPGVYEVIWDGVCEEGRRAASGIYFCRVRSGEYSYCSKMLLVR